MSPKPGFSQTPQPATPRMLRSVSGSVKSSLEQPNSKPMPKQEKELLPSAAIGQGAPKAPAENAPQQQFYRRS
ncbi:hypothetical protein OXX79_010858, partial [Metschnikowia pulcherrima]